MRGLWGALVNATADGQCPETNLQPYPICQVRPFLLKLIIASVAALRNDDQDTAADTTVYIYKLIAAISLALIIEGFTTVAARHQIADRFVGVPKLPRTHTATNQARAPPRINNTSVPFIDAG